MNSTAVNTQRYKKSADENTSLLKLVGGAMAAIRASCKAAKSAMLFCRSRIFLKKSLDVSEAGLIVLGGARAGPSIE